MQVIISIKKLIPSKYYTYSNCSVSISPVKAAAHVKTDLINAVVIFLQKLPKKMRKRKLAFIHKPLITQINSNKKQTKYVLKRK